MDQNASNNMAGLAALLEGFRSGQAANAQQKREDAKSAREGLLSDAQAKYYQAHAGSLNPTVSGDIYDQALSRVGISGAGLSGQQIPVQAGQAYNDLVTQFRTAQSVRETKKNTEKAQAQVSKWLTGREKTILSNIGSLKGKLAAAQLNMLANNEDPQAKATVVSIQTQLQHEQEQLDGIRQQGKMLGLPEYSIPDAMPISSPLDVTSTPTDLGATLPILPETAPASGGGFLGGLFK